MYTAIFTTCLQPLSAVKSETVSYKSEPPEEEEEEMEFIIVRDVTPTSDWGHKSKTPTPEPSPEPSVSSEPFI